MSFTTASPTPRSAFRMGLGERPAIPVERKGDKPRVGMMAGCGHGVLGDGLRVRVPSTNRQKHGQHALAVQARRSSVGRPARRRSPRHARYDRYSDSRTPPSTGPSPLRGVVAGIGFQTDGGFGVTDGHLGLAGAIRHRPRPASLESGWGDSNSRPLDPQAVDGLTSRCRPVALTCGFSPVSCPCVLSSIGLSHPLRGL